MTGILKKHRHFKIDSQPFNNLLSIVKIRLFQIEVFRKLHIKISAFVLQYSFIDQSINLLYELML
jgi:hypothetical protein